MEFRKVLLRNLWMWYRILCSARTIKCLSAGILLRDVSVVSPWRACARVTVVVVCVCVCVYLSVPALAASATRKQRYSQVSLGFSWILIRGSFESYGVKKPICK